MSEPRRITGALRDPSVWIATGAGSGFFPVAPATFASLILALVLWILGGAGWGVRLALLGVWIVVGTWTADRAERHFGHDARCIVIDEVAGYWLSVLFVPWDGLHLIAAFFLFRGFDVLKPPPAYQVQSLPGGWGIMADDLVAGLYTVLVLRLAGLVFPGFA
ncbi:MAG: phosphatidylglycerophosphatase A [Candidatus Eisenbacteria bacterium]|nr:phosphatidylglycerophosphatase A [Candidatus Eisenbacteria bacterium]